ncbi:conserved hypothetical protein [Bacillus altitudinis]|uniref:Uncharacterized protein n=1 Tax=Bacillus aerius TaxID=293388 RepID=A0ABR6B1R1_9BACI|nr:hypothetical protein BAME_35100 [Bacillus sp. M 2-6]MBA8917823.1 hypothetical protein [Bacillus aerius]SPR93662.1 conserved hypothetical protein [Bacillus altitudinis]
MDVAFFIFYGWDTSYTCKGVFSFEKIGVFMNLSDAALCGGTGLQKEEKEK